MAGRIPPAHIPLIDQRGIMTAPWYRYFAKSENLEPGQITAGDGLTGGGDVSAGVSIAIADHGVGDDQLREALATSVIGRFQGTDGPVADIQATDDNRVLGRFDGQLVFKDLSLLPVTVPDGDKGDITIAAGVWTVDAGAITYAKMQDVSATDKLLGRATSGSGDVEEITCTAAGRALIDDADAAAQRVTIGLGPVTGWGDPTNTLSRSTFDSTTVTLPDLAARVAQLILDLKGKTLLAS